MSDVKREYLSPKDVSEIIGVCMTNTYKLFNLKGFPKIKIGRKYFIKKDDFDKYLSEHKMSEIFIS